MNDKARDPFDLKALELPDDLIPTKRVILSKERRRLSQFVQFPNTWAWRLRKTRSAAPWKLAHYLLWRHWLRQRQRADESFTLSNLACAQLGISRFGKHRALMQLEGLGLIRVMRRENRNPQVALLFPGPDAGEPCDHPDR